MTYPVYPLDKCPYPVRDSFSSQYGRPFARTEMDDSHGRVRRKFAMVPVNYSLTWHMSFEQFKWFEAFLKYDCAQASGFFTMPLNPVSAPIDMRFTSYPDSAFDQSLGAWVVSGTVEWVRQAPTGNLSSVLPTFPAVLPMPEQSNYSIKRAGTVARSTLTEGEASQRARFKDEVALVQYQWQLDADEFAVWDDFVHNALLGGLAPFKGPFANGMGLSTIKINFIDTPKVTSNGAAYTVTAQAEVRDIPTISEFVYRGYGNINLSDTIVWDAELFAELGTFARDQFAYQDSVSFKIGKPQSDSISYSDAIAVKINANRSLDENLMFNDSSITFNIKRSLPVEYLVFKTTGQACFEDYATDYVQYGYDAKCIAFAAEEDLQELYTLNDAVTIGFSGVRQFTENMTLSATGGIVGNQYCETDYVQFGYTADSLATFQN